MNETYPSIHGELQLSHEYADTEKFTDVNIYGRAAHYERMLLDPHLSAQALGEVAVIYARVGFEADKRMEEFKAGRREN